MNEGSSIAAGVLAGGNFLDKRAGDIVINATGDLHLIDSTIANRVFPNAIGHGRDITIIGRDRASLNNSTGNGGIAAGPLEPLSQRDALTELVPLPQGEETGVRLRRERSAERSQEAGGERDQHQAADEIVEVQGWVQDAQGQVWLVADAAVGIPHSPAIAPPPCAKLAMTKE